MSKEDVKMFKQNDVAFETMKYHSFVVDKELNEVVTVHGKNQIEADELARKVAELVKVFGVLIVEKNLGLKVM